MTRSWPSTCAVSGFVELSYEDVVRWLHTRVGERISLTIGLGVRVPLAVCGGELVRGIDPSLHRGHTDRFSDVIGEVLAFGVGVSSSYTVFTVSEARFAGAWVRRAESAEVLAVQQGAVVITVAPEGFDL
jgi:hypothetical protein